MKARFSLLLLLLPSALRSQTPLCPSSPSKIRIDSGLYSSRPGVTFQLHHFVATLVPRGTRPPSCLQKLTVVDHADIFVSSESLTNVFTEKLGASNSKIKNLKIENAADSATLTGTLKKLIPINFTIQGPVTTDGQSLLLTATTIKADGIPIKELLGIVGQHLSSVLTMNGVKGVAVNENVISFAPEQVANLKGNIESVQTSPQGLTLHYRHKQATPHAKVVAAVPPGPHAPLPPR